MQTTGMTEQALKAIIQAGEGNQVENECLDKHAATPSNYGRRRICKRVQCLIYAARPQARADGYHC